MRQSLFVLCLIFTLGVTVPAEGQLRSDTALEEARVRLYDYGQTGFSLNRLFDPLHFRMSHSLEFSSGSYGGSASSMGMYTNTMMWQFNQKLAARLDVAMSYSPFSDERLQGVTGNNSGRVFIRNAEIAFRPTENSRIHLSFQQSPYGQYASPYGQYGYGMSGYGMSGYGGRRGSSATARFGSVERDLFWNDRNQ